MTNIFSSPYLPICHSLHSECKMQLLMCDFGRRADELVMSCDGACRIDAVNQLEEIVSAYFGWAGFKPVTQKGLQTPRRIGHEGAQVIRSSSPGSGRRA